MESDGTSRAVRPPAGSTEATVRPELLRAERLSRIRLCLAEPGALERTRNAIQQVGHGARVGIHFIQRGAEQRARNRVWLSPGALGELGELPGGLIVQRDCQPYHCVASGDASAPATAAVSRAMAAAV
jgi:hypothetical protein